MTIPDAQTLMRPILAYLADGQAKSAKDVIAAMSDEFGLSDDERAQMLPSGRQRTMYDRVHWSLTHMSQDCSTVPRGATSRSRTRAVKS